MPAQQVLRIFFKLFPPFAFAVQSDSVRRLIGFRPPSGGKCTKKDRASVGVHVLGLYS